MADKQVKVALWCVPRSMSTVFSKSMSAIDEMTVYFELYSYAAVAAGLFESSTGRVFPKQLDGNEADYEEAKEIWKKITNSTITPRRISCHDIKRDLENAKSKYVFIKEMSYVIDFVQDYLPQGFRYVFLIREPSRVYSSFRKGRLTSELSIPEVELDLIRDDRANMLPMLWYEKQHQIWKHVKENYDPNPIIIDAFDLASEPQKILKGFCDAVGFPYNDSLLQWAPSKEDFPKNFVTAGEDLFKQISTFYSTAFSTTQFMAPSESGPIPHDQLTDDVIRCVDHSMPFYREMYKNRLQAS